MKYTYSPEQQANAAHKRTSEVLALSARVEAGDVSSAAAKLALTAGGYPEGVVTMVDALGPPADQGPVAGLMQVLDEALDRYDDSSDGIIPDKGAILAASIRESLDLYDHLNKNPERPCDP